MDEVSCGHDLTAHLVGQSAPLDDPEPPSQLSNAGDRYTQALLDRDVSQELGTRNQPRPTPLIMISD